MGSPTSGPQSGGKKPFALLRDEMVARNISARDVRDELVLGAMRKVPRELFLPENMREFAYEDAPLPIAGELARSFDRTPTHAIIIARRTFAACLHACQFRRD
jgi:protein-L-isoaspartate O-methyltransferase